MPRGQAHLGDLTQSRVRLLRGRRVDAGADAAALRASPSGPGPCCADGFGLRGLRMSWLTVGISLASWRRVPFGRGASGWVNLVAGSEPRPSERKIPAGSRGARSGGVRSIGTGKNPRPRKSALHSRKRPFRQRAARRSWLRPVVTRSYPANQPPARSFTGPPSAEGRGGHEIASPRAPDEGRACRGTRGSDAAGAAATNPHCCPDLRPWPTGRWSRSWPPGRRVLILPRESSGPPQR